MEKDCMFSTVLLWSLAESVMGCWARAAPVINRNKTPAREFRVSSSKFRGKHVFPTWECVGRMGVPPPPHLILVFMELRRYKHTWLTHFAGQFLLFLASFGGL